MGYSGKLLAAVALMVSGLFAGTAHAGSIPSPQDGSSWAIFSGLLAGGWSYNDLNKKDAGGEASVIVHGDGIAHSTRSRKGNVDYAFCVLSIDGARAVKAANPDVIVRWLGSTIEVKIWQGGCVHESGPASGAIAAKANGEGFILMFKRLGAFD